MKRLFAIFLISHIINVVSAQVLPTKPEESKFEVTKSELNFGAKGEKKTIEVTSEKKWTIILPKESKDWVKVRKIGDSSVTIEVDDNPNIKGRETSFTINNGDNRNKTIKIKQSAAVFKVDGKSSYSFEASGGNEDITVNSTYDWEAQILDSDFGKNGIDVSKVNKKLKISVKKNPNTKRRKATIVLTSKGNKIKIEVTQQASPSKPKTKPKLQSDNNEKTELPPTIQKSETPAKEVPEPQMFNISESAANFAYYGGRKTFTVSSNRPWEISQYPEWWCTLRRDGNNLVLEVKENESVKTKSTYFIIKSEDKSIRVDINQAASPEKLTVNNSDTEVSLNFSSYGGYEALNVSTNLGNYDLKWLPSFCYVRNKSEGGFSLWCERNNTSDDKNDYFWVSAGSKKVKIKIHQYPNYNKLKRKRNGGWVNMSMGYEGGYNPSDDAWFVNAVVGMRIGNYRDILQFEIGVSPGIVTSSLDDSGVFHLPIYGSLKLSTTNGRFYFKAGGAYNIVYDDYYEGEYSLRAGFGSAWKHFEWDWAYVQFNASANGDYWYDKRDMFDTSNMYIGMRMAWYITR